MSEVTMQGFSPSWAMVGVFVTVLAVLIAPFFIFLVKLGGKVTDVADKVTALSQESKETKKSIEQYIQAELIDFWERKVKPLESNIDRVAKDSEVGLVRVEKEQGRLHVVIQDEYRSVRQVLEKLVETGQKNEIQLATMTERWKYITNRNSQNECP